MDPEERTTRNLPSQGSPPSEECLLVQKHLEHYTDGELDAIRTNLVEAHLKVCRTCSGAREELENERLWLIEAAVDAPALSDRFRGKILGKVAGEKRARVAGRRRDFILRFSSVAAAALVFGFAILEFQGRPALRDETAPTRGDRHEVALVPPEAPLPFEAPSPTVSDEEDGDPDCPFPWDREEDVRILAAHSPQRSRSVAVWAPFLVSNFGDVVSIARELRGTSELSPADKGNPCRPDPNRDGSTDLEDMAYCCQVIMVGLPPHILEEQEVMAPDPNCEDVCLRA